MLANPDFSVSSFEYKEGLRGSEKDEPAHYYHVFFLPAVLIKKLSKSAGSGSTKGVWSGPFEAENTDFSA